MPTPLVPAAHCGPNPAASSDASPAGAETSRSSRSKLRALAATVVAAGLVLAGCARGDGTDTSATEASGQSASGERVASLGLGDSDTLMALGITPVTLAAWGQQGDVHPSGVGPWSRSLLGDATPPVIYNVAQGVTPEILEAVSSTKPTKIMAVNQDIDKSGQDALTKIAPLTVRPANTIPWQVPWDVQVRTIADAVDKEDKGDELIAQTKEVFEKFRKDHPELQGKKAAVVMPYDGKLGLYTSGDGRGSFVESLGFEIPQELEGDGKVFYQEIAPENYDTLNTVDYLFVLDYKGALEYIKRDPSFQRLDVVRDNRVRYLTEDTGNAMSMPNPVTIPWAVEQFTQQL